MRDTTGERPIARRRALALIAAGAAAALGACTETAGDLASAPPRARAPGVPVAVVSLEGVPETMAARVNGALVAQAERREIQIVTAASEARYRLRGYLAAYAIAEGSTELAWTWDIFDAAARRARRVSGTAAVRQTAADPWTVIGDAALHAMAAMSLDDVAEFLASAPPAATGPAVASAAAARRAASLVGIVGVR